MKLKQKLGELTLPKKITIVIAIVLLIAIIIVVFFLPFNAVHSRSFTKRNAVLDSAWQSEDIIIGDETYAIFTIVSDNARNREVLGSDVIHLEIPTKNGILKNRYAGDMTAFVFTEESLNSFDYDKVNGTNVAKDAENGDMLFCSLIPTDCVRVTVNGTEATIYENTVPLNGKQILYKFFYCKYNNPARNTNPDVICYDSAGNSHNITVN